MAVLGFVGTPPTPITYDAFDALAARATAYGRSLAAARQAAQFALLRGAGIVVGGGLFGYAIGQAIMDKVSQETAEVPVRQLYKVDGNQGKIRVNATVELQGVGVLNFENDFDSPVVIPIAQPATGGTFRYGALVGPNATFVGYFQAAPDQQLSPFRVTSVTKVDGSPATLRKVPAPALPIVPYEPVKVPVSIPIIPGEPDFPITPTVIPAPENDPDEDNKQGEPGVIVQIPELGTQIKFTPTGVTIGRYTSPDTKPFEEPRYAFPPNTPPPASDVCPCPEEKGKSEEIICRVKTLQKEILNDGYTFNTTIIPEGTGGSGTVTTGELVQANVFVTSFPANIKRQPYPAVDSDVLWVGWFTWTKEGRGGERIPLQFENNSFYPPPECDGFKYAFNYGVQGSGSFVTRVKKQYVDLCAT